MLFNKFIEGIYLSKHRFSLFIAFIYSIFGTTFFIFLVDFDMNLFDKLFAYFIFFLGGLLGGKFMFFLMKKMEKIIINIANKGKR